MSSIDNRIVRMQFDNEDFERGVMQSMKTIDALNEKLQFKEADKGISALQVHLNNVDFSGMAKAIDHIDGYFTSMTGMVKKRIKEDIVDEVISAAKKLEQMTLGQIKSGGMARAKNIANAKFMIEGLKFDWDAVRQAADYAVTDTAYGLDAAAKAASQLAASGVDFMETIEEVNGTKLTQMHKSLRAISGVAAMTNSSYEEIAHIFTAVAGMGKLTAMQMNQLSLRGLNIASTIAEQTGKTEQEIREMVSKGMIDFQMFSEAMDNAYGEHAKEANKTFEGSLSNLKAALSRIGAIFTQPVIDKTNTFFVALTGRIKEFQKALSDEKDVRITEKALKRITKQANDEARAHKYAGTEYVRYVNDTIAANKKAILENKASLTNGDAEEYSIARFATHFAEAWEAAINFVSKVTESLDLSWFKSIGSFLDASAQKVTKFFNSASTAIDKVKASVDKTSASIADSLELDMNDLNLLHRILKNEFGYVEERWAKLDEIYKKQGSTKTGKWLQGYMDQLAGVGYHFEKLGWTEEEFKKKQEELAKSEAERIQGWTREESVIYSLSRAYENVTKMMDGIKRTVSNLIKAFSNIADALWRTLLNFGLNFRAQFPIWKITDGLADLSGAFSTLTEALVPPIDAMIKVGHVGKTVGKTLSTVTSFVFDGAKAFIEFVAACLKAEESLDDLAKNESLTALQRTTLNVMRVVNNVWRFIKAWDKVLLKIAKSIGTAFSNVFGGEQFGRSLAIVSDGVAGVSGAIATVAEKIADSEAPFKVIETILGTLFLIINKLVNLLSVFHKSIRMTINGTEDVADAADQVNQKGKKGITFLQTLGKYVGKAIVWLKELPGKIKTVWEALKETDGYKHLVDSFKNLKKQFLDFYDNSINPMTRGLDEVATRAGGTGDTLLGKLASGIGIVADKIAGFMDKIPEYGTKIKTFFEDTKKWFDKTIKDLGLDQMGQSIAKAFGDLFTSDESIFKKIKKFAEDVFFTVVDGLSGVDWKGVGKGSFLALVAVNLFNFFKITDNVNKIVKGVANFPTLIGQFFTNLGGVFKTAQSALDRVSKAYTFVAIAQSVLAIAAAVVILAQVPRDDLNRALAALIVIGGVMALVMVAFGKMIQWMTKGNGIMKNANNTVDNSVKKLVEINNSFSRLIGVAALLVGFAGSLWIIAKAIGELKNAIKDINDPKLLKTIFVTIGVIGAVVAVVGGLMFTLALLLGNANTGPTLIGLSMVMASITGSVFVIAKTIQIISENPVDENAVRFVLGTFALIAAFTLLMMKCMSGIKISSAVAVVIVLAGLVGAITLILGEILLLSAVLAGSEILGGKLGVTPGAINDAFAIVASIILALGASLYLIGKGVSKVEKPSALVGAIAAMAAIIFAVALAFKVMGKIAKESGDTTLAIMILGMVAVVGIIAAALDRTMKHVSGMGGDEGSKVLQSLGLAFIMIGASLWIIAKAAEQFMGADLIKGIVPALGFLIIMAVAISGIVDALKMMKDIDGFSTAIQSIAVAFIAIGGAMLLIGLAAQMFNDVSPEALTTMAVVMAVMVGIFAILAALFVVSEGKGKGGIASGLEKAVKTMKDLGIALVLMGASVLLAGIGCGVLAAGLGKLAEGIGVLANAFNEHKATVAILIAMVAMIAIVIMLVLKSVEPVAPLVLNTTTKVMDAVTTVVSAIGKVLKNGKDKFVKWWKNMQPGLKIMIASGIVTVCGAILKASPEVLATIKKLIWKVLDFLIDIVPTLVGKLFDLLLKLINSLADTIRKRSAQIAYAFWNLIESLVEVLMEVLGQAVMLIFGGTIFSGLGDKLANVLSAGKGALRAHLDEMKVYVDEAEDLTEGWENNVLAMDSMNGSDLAKKAKDEMEKTSKAADKASDSIDNAKNSYADYMAARYGASTSSKKEDSGFDISGIADKFGMSTDDLLGQVKLGNISAEDMGMDMDQFQSMFGDIGAVGADGMVEGYSTEMEEQHSEFYNTADDAIQEGPVAAIQDSEVDISRATEKHIVHPMNQQVRDSKDRFAQNMYYAALGASEGIEKALPMINKSVNQLVTVTDQGFRDPLEIDSPSKVFMRYGGYLLQGLVNGIDKSVPEAEGSVSNLAGTIINTFGNPLNYISKILSGELSVDPSIQPVLDTSRISRGSAAVSAMLNGQAVSIGGLSGQIAADIGELDSRNVDIVMELRALREDMAVMGEEISNMQVVMDTGALVGATAGPMDKALGQRAVRFGRGN